MIDMNEKIMKVFILCVQLFPFSRLSDEIVLNLPQPQLKLMHGINVSVAEIKQSTSSTKAS